MQQNKEVLRRVLRERRSALAPDWSARLSGIICQLAIALPAFVQARSVGIYRSVDREVDPEPLVNHAFKAKKRVALPVVDTGRGGMVFVEWAPGAPLIAGPFGIPQPPWSGDLGDVVGWGELSLIFLPVVGFDDRGWRIGYGGGYFDRYLAAGTGRGPYLVGLAYGFQEVDQVPVEAHDRMLDCVITEKGVKFFHRAPFFDQGSTVLRGSVKEST